MGFFNYLFWTLLIPNKKRLTIIGESLTKIGENVINNDNKDIVKDNIIEIINALSDEIELGGTIDDDIKKILLNHEGLVSELKDPLKKILLKTLNEKLPIKDILKEGEYKIVKEGTYNLEFICFNFQKYEKCKIIIGPVTGGNHLHFVLFIEDNNNEKVKPFRATGIYCQRIKDSQADLRNPINGIGNINLPIIDFANDESMKYYLENMNELSNIIADRVEYCFNSKKINNLTIKEFLEENVGK